MMICSNKKNITAVFILFLKTESLINTHIIQCEISTGSIINGNKLAMDNHKKYYNLWEKKEEFTNEEFSFLKSFLKNKKIMVSYGFYVKESQSKKQIAVIFDLIPFQTRRTGVENNWEIVSKRLATSKEIEDFINYYFRNCYKRFLVFYYKNIDKLIYDDMRLQAQTPQKFIDECRKRNYSGSYQIKAEF